MKKFCLILFLSPFFISPLFAKKSPPLATEFKKSYIPKNTAEVKNNPNLNGLIQKRYGSGAIKEDLFYDKGQLLQKKIYHRNGRLKKEVSYRNGKIEGVAKEYDQNGRLKKDLYYLEGKLDGPCKNYDQNGRPKSIWHFKKGNLIRREKLN